jgi:predicted MFS family arabinose efflux permease
MKNSIPYLAIFMTLFASFLGLFASFFIPSSPSSACSLNVDLQLWRATLAMLKQANKAPRLLLTILTISWFWLLGAVLLTKLPDYCHYVLSANASVFACFLALFSIGIALGSLFVNTLLRGRITLVLVPRALFAFTVFLFDLYWASPTVEIKEPLLEFIVFFTYLTHLHIAVDLLMLGFCGGLFIVPLYTYLQVISPPGERGRTIAANNIYNSLFMVLGTGIVMLLLRFNVSIPVVFLLFSVLNAAVALILFFCLRTPDYNE